MGRTAAQDLKPPAFCPVPELSVQENVLGSRGELRPVDPNERAKELGFVVEAALSCQFSGLRSAKMNERVTLEGGWMVGNPGAIAGPRVWAAGRVLPNGKEFEVVLSVVLTILPR